MVRISAGLLLFSSRNKSPIINIRSSYYKTTRPVRSRVGKRKRNVTQGGDSFDSTTDSVKIMNTQTTAVNQEKPILARLSETKGLGMEVSRNRSSRGRNKGSEHTPATPSRDHHYFPQKYATYQYRSSIQALEHDTRGRKNWRGGQCKERGRSVKRRRGSLGENAAVDLADAGGLVRPRKTPYIA